MPWLSRLPLKRQSTRRLTHIGISCCILLELKWSVVSILSSVSLLLKRWDVSTTLNKMRPQFRQKLADRWQSLYPTSSKMLCLYIGVCSYSGGLTGRCNRFLVHCRVGGVSSFYLDATTTRATQSSASDSRMPPDGSWFFSSFRSVTIRGSGTRVAAPGWTDGRIVIKMTDAWLPVRGLPKRHSLLTTAHIISGKVYFQVWGEKR